MKLYEVSLVDIRWFHCDFHLHGKSSSCPWIPEGFVETSALIISSLQQRNQMPREANAFAKGRRIAH